MGLEGFISGASDTPAAVTSMNLKTMGISGMLDTHAPHYHTTILVLL